MKKQYFFLMVKFSFGSIKKIHRAKNIKTLEKYYEENIKNQWEEEHTFYIVEADKSTHAKSAILFNETDTGDEERNDLYKSIFGTVLKKTLGKGILKNTLC